MGNQVKDNDLQVKKYLENQMGFTTTSCRQSNKSVIYSMYNQEYDCVMIYEMCGDGALKFSIGDECRTLPKPEDLQKQLPDTVTQQTIIRLVIQIVTRLLDNTLDDTKRAIRDKFGRHARKLI